MGRRSLQKKKLKRQMQKNNKKRRLHLENATPISDNVDHDAFSSATSWGSPSSPPLFSENGDDCSQSNNTPYEQDNEFGLDETVFCFNEDLKTSFENPNGECLEGTELVDYLVTTNKKLAEKVESYRKKCEETEDQSYEKEIKCQQKIKSIRHFYRNLILLSNSRSAINVKKISFPAIMIMDIL